MTRKLRGEGGRSTALLAVVALLVMLVTGIDRGQALAEPDPQRNLQGASVGISLNPGSTEVMENEIFNVEIVADTGLRLIKYVIKLTCSTLPCRLGLPFYSS